MRHVAIVGTGPSGILGAYGALDAGAEVTLFAHPDHPRVSSIHGAQYIHKHIPGLPDSMEPFELRYRHFGTEADYRTKIYGGEISPGGTSWDLFRPIEWAWSMEEVYLHCCQVVAKNCVIIDQAIDLDGFQMLADQYDHVFNSAPLQSIPGITGQFTWQMIMALGGKNIYGVPRNEVWYLADHHVRAYRTSNIGGVVFVEWPGSNLETLGQWDRRKAVVVSKPLAVKNLNLRNVHLIGRYGKWKKGTLAHEAYDEVRLAVLENRPWTASHQG